MSQDADTGDAVTSPSLAPLEGLDQLPVHEHVARFEAVHDALAARLEGAEDRPGTGA
jgi:hypothetical protein